VISRRPNRSVAARFRLAIFIIFGAGSIAALLAAWLFARSAADETYDGLLQSAAVQMADTVEQVGGRYRVVPPDSAFDTLAFAEDDRFFYSVRSPSGALLTGYADLPAASVPRSPTAMATRNANFAGAAVRIGTMRKFVGPTEKQGWITTTVAQTLHARNAMRLRLFGKSAPVMLAMAVMGLIAALFGAKVAVRPLVALENVLARRQPQDLTPLEIDSPRETLGLIDAINALMQRLSDRLEGLQQFASLSAHQLRTPLTAIAAQIDLLAHEENDRSRTARIARVKRRLTELNRLVHQLLGQAMVAYRGETARRSRIDLSELARSAGGADLPEIEGHELELIVHAPCSIFVDADVVMVREAVANLVSNAVHHGARSKIVVTAAEREGFACLGVADDGPGIPAEAWGDVGRPFSSNGGGGVGLGLSIVRQIAEMHGGSITVDRDGNEFFRVTMRFPVADRLP
jgi:two-component system, OmpR family, sensor histidine kinase TctE